MSSLVTIIRFFCTFTLVMGMFTLSSGAYAHGDGDARPVYLKFKFHTGGQLYEALKAEFEPEWLQEDEMMRNTPMFGVHEVDLNGDGIAELIIRFPNQYTTCNDIGCHHAVVSNTDGEITRLGYFEFAELDVATTQTEGVKDLLVYDSALNDFSGTLYKWSASQQKYIKN